MSLLLAGAVLAPLGQPAEAFKFFGVGVGQNTCAQYLAASQGVEPNHVKNLYKDGRHFVSENNVYDQWIGGAVTAFNYASAENGNKHPDVIVDNVELLTWVREWCGTHSDSKVFTALETYMHNRWNAGGAVVPPSQASEASPPPVTGSTDAMYVSVIFQDDVSQADTQAFLQAYQIAGMEGPNANGSYKLRLSAPLPADQFQQVLDSMKSQTKIVKTAEPG